MTDAGEALEDARELAAAVRAELCGPGGRFETAVEEVRGQEMVVFANRHRSVRDQLSAVCADHADTEFLVLNDMRLTYAEVQQRVASVSRRLLDLGVASGDRVAILAANRPEWVITFYATTAIGAVAAALNGWWTAPELDHAIQLCEPRVVVGDTRRLARASGFGDDVIVVDMDIDRDFFAPEPDASMPTVPIDEDDPALILFTSGTTGRSKGATVSHRGLVGFVDGALHSGAEKRLIALRSMGVDPESLPVEHEINLNTSPLFHVSGLLAGILLNAATGTTVVFREGRFDPADVLRLVEEERVTSWTAIGSMGPRVMDHPDMETRDLSSLKRVGSGGAHLSEHMQQRIREAFPQAGHAIGQGYGSSESVGVVTSIGGPEFQANPSATGRACLGFEIQIRDERDNVLPDGVEGEVHVRSPYSMLGYWGDPEATAATLKADGWLAMGDVGRLQDGMLYLNSRARDMILRSGENIYPVEIESCLEAHPDVAEVAVLGVDHPEHGQEVKAVVVPAGDAFDRTSLQAWAEQRLAAYKVPTHWERRDEPLPRTASGKVVKAAITGERQLSDHQD